MRRTPIDIEAKILSVALGGATKYNIVRSVNLSGGGATRYLYRLIEQKLLKFDEKTRLYRTTPAGLEFLKFYRELERLRLR